MAKENLTNKEELEEILSEFKYKVDILYRVRDRIEDLINQYEKIVLEMPAQELNALISFGFVPNAVFMFDDKEITFCGYTEGSRMKFKYKDGKIAYTDIVAVYKNLERFKHNQ